MPSCFRLFWHFDRAAASRTFCTAGSNNPIRIAMIAITTSNSIRVNARFRPAGRDGEGIMSGSMGEAGRIKGVRASVHGGSESLSCQGDLNENHDLEPAGSRGSLRFGGLPQVVAT